MQSGWRIGAGVCVLMAASCASAQDTVTIWSCKDKDGRTHVTNIRDDTHGKECRIVQQGAAPAPPPAKPAAPAAKDSKSPAGFPKETRDSRRAARERQREVLERELAQEQTLLGKARQALGQQEAVRTGEERNYARVIERLQPYKDTVELHQKNVEALQRELNNLYK